MPERDPGTRRNRLLQRQIRRLLGGHVPPEFEAFVDGVEEAYGQFDSERELLERSLGLTSDELITRNLRLTDELEAGRQLQEKLRDELEGRKKAERELRRTMFRLGEARRVFGLGYWEWHIRTGEAMWSEEMFRLYGYEPGQVVPSQRLFVRHCHPGDLRALTQVFRFYRPDQPRELDYRIVRADGEERVLRVSTTRSQDPDADPNTVFGICYDITAQRRFEQDLVAARTRAEEAQRHAEELLRLKSSLLDNISHELRTPLAAVIGFADILMNDLEGERQEFARLIQQSGERLLETLNSVLTLASVDSGNARLAIAPLDLVAEVRATVEMVRPQAARKGLLLDVEADKAVWVLADTGALHRILQNLVGNAIKFTRQGRVCIRVRPGAEQDPAVLEVEDTGIGIDEVFLPYVFEAFHQESKGMARAHEGAGLGLTIVKKLVTLMNGTTEAVSRVGEGTTMRVWLPAATAPAPRVSAPKFSVAEAAGVRAKESARRA